MLQSGAEKKAQHYIHVEAMNEEEEEDNNAKKSNSLLYLALASYSFLIRIYKADV